MSGPPTLRCAPILLVAVLVPACGAGPADSAPAVSSVQSDGLIGNPAPEFDGKAIRGAKGTISLRGMRGMVVLVDFWGTFCEPCRKSFPKLEQLRSEYGASGLRIIGISEDEPDDREKIPAFADAYGAKFILVWDENKSAARAFKPDTMPSSFLIDRNGIVRFAHVGYREGQEVELAKEIRELLSR